MDKIVRFFKIRRGPFDGVKFLRTFKPVCMMNKTDDLGGN